MAALAVLPAVCWLWVLIASPGTSLSHGAFDALLRERLHAHRRRLISAACVVSMLALLAFVLARPSGIDADAAALRQIHAGSRSAPMLDTSDTRGCFATWLVAPVCWRLQPDRSWAVEGQLDDGTWVKATPLDDGIWSVVGIVVTPGAYPSGESGDGIGG